MPEITLIHAALFAAMLLAGFVLGWWYRSDRSRREKMAITAGWQAQIDSQQSEHDRLAEQNTSLMEQISQYQASNKDSKMRARELSDSLKEAFQRRDELQRQLKDIRGNLEVAIVQRDKLQTDVGTTRSEADVQALQQRDARIAKLNQDLENWQQRVPPLVERYRQRDLEAQQVEIELQAALAKIADLESQSQSEHTRIEPVDSDSLPDGLDASNEPHTDTSVLSSSVLEDQIDDDPANEEVGAQQANEAVEQFDEMLESADDDWSDEQAQSFDANDDTSFEALLDGADSDSDIDRRGEASSEEPADAAAPDDDMNLTDSEDVHEQPPEDVPLSNFGAECEAPAVSDSPDAHDVASNGYAIANIGEEQSATTCEEQNAVGYDEAGGNGVDESNAFPNMLTDDYATGMPAQDNLRLIKGVGPAIEKILNDLGIFRFDQIAKMSEYDIDRVAHQLKGFRSRIYREDWIGQARTLQYEQTRR